MSQVDLSWTDNSGTQFRVYRSTVSNPSFPADYTVLGTTAAGVSTFTDSDPPRGIFSYAVTAFDATGESEEITQTLSTIEQYITITGSGTTDRPATGSAATDRPAVGSAQTDRPATSSAEADRPATSSAATDRPATGSAATDRPTAGDNTQQ